MKQILQCSTAIAAAMAVIAPALAQPDASDADIIVTARKRDETSIATPVVLTAIGGLELQRRAINSIDGLARAVPQLITGESGGSAQGGSITLRGVGGADGNPFADQAVSFNIDGVAISRSGVRRLAGMDIAQIEVLKGPQALFFGKNSPGGIISLRTADPTPGFEMKLSGGYEFHAREWRGEGYVAGPITDTLGFRVAAYGSRMQGWLTNIAPTTAALANPERRVGESEEYAVRGTLKWEPSDSFDARLKVSYANVHNDGAVTMTQLIGCPFGAPQLGNPRDCQANDLTTRGRLGQNFGKFDSVFGDGHTYLHTAQTLASLEMNYHLNDALTLTSVTGYFKFRTRWVDTFNLTLNPSTLLASSPNFDTEEVSQEVRLTSSYDGPLNFMIGGYYQHSSSDAFSTTYFNADNPTFLNKYIYYQKGDAWSAFAQAQWKILPTLELSAGGRYSDEIKHLPLILSASAAGAPLLVTQTAVDRGRWNNFSPEATLNWRPSEDVTVFASYKKGFLSGGFNAAAGGYSGNLSYNQQNIFGFEGGIKTALFDRRLRTDLAVYSYTVTGLQVVTFPNGIQAVTTNAGRVQIRGIELSGTYRTPVTGLSLRGSINYLDGKYKDYTASCYTGQTQALGCNFGAPRMVADPANPGQMKPIYSAQNLSNTPLTRAPEWTGNIGFDWQVPLSSGWKLGLSSDATFSDGYLTDPASKPDGYQKAYTILDASVRLGTADDKWEVALIGRNLTNLYYFARSSDQTFTGSGTGDVAGRLADTGGGMNRGREIFLRFTVKLGQ